MLLSSAASSIIPWRFGSDSVINKTHIVLLCNKVSCFILVSKLLETEDIVFVSVYLTLIKQTTNVN